ncbi:hypothetical protein TSAR_011577 [Trichomalopsis sarcophagae]|uniref:Uncharacterized protein n=1 Tax=Trichomalopsis sarcophagae TaxID=543379 RepID=A0A232EM99_9HYME|nr:hypothetical protein TSAR_011577 [Trichomalopsis sarcophagae]
MPNTATLNVNSAAGGASENILEQADVQGAVKAATVQEAHSMYNWDCALKCTTEVLGIRVNNIDKLCQKLIRWGTRLTDEINQRGKTIQQNSQDIRYLSQHCADLTNAQNTAGWLVALLLYCCFELSCQLWRIAWYLE